MFIFYTKWFFLKLILKGTLLRGEVGSGSASKQLPLTCIIIALVQHVECVGGGVVPTGGKTAVLSGASVTHPSKGGHGSVIKSKLSGTILKNISVNILNIPND